MPTVSVIIPTYDDADILPRAVQSVLEQTYSDFEVVVVDDASTDDTEEKVAGMDDPRIQFVSHETNQGGSAARNTGLRRATGEFVAFLDADDEWREEKLERQLARLDSKPEGWIAAYCGFRRVRDHSGRLGGLVEFGSRVVHREGGPSRSIGWEGGEDLIPHLLTMEFTTGGCSTLLVERTAVQAIGGFSESFDRHQDYEFLVRLLQEGKLAYVDEILVVKHESGFASAETVAASKEQMLSTFSDTIERFEREGYDITGIHTYSLALLYLRDGHWRRGLSYLREAGLRGSYLPLIRAVLSCVRMKLGGGSS